MIQLYVTCIYQITNKITYITCNCAFIYKVKLLKLSYNYLYNLPNIYNISHPLHQIITKDKFICFTLFYLSQKYIQVSCIEIELCDRGELILLVSPFKYLNY